MKKKLVTAVLGVSVLFINQASSTLAAATLDDLLGISYEYGGDTTAGFDCSGFTKYVFKDFKIDLPHSSSSQFDTGEKVNKEELRPGDLVFFDTSDGNGISHVGIFVGNDQFAHSASGKGTRIDKLSSDYYEKRYVGACRVLKENQPYFCYTKES